MEGVTNYGYASTSSPSSPSKPFVFRLALGRPEDLRLFREAHEANDDASMGRFLGYPPCCTAAFVDDWVVKGSVDSTWSAACRSGGAPKDESVVEVDGPPEANILLRWTGLRGVPHLPCSFQCEDTVMFARRLRQCSEHLVFVEEMAWLYEALSWPVQWSALHGIAEIKMPLMRIVSRADATKTEYRVLRRGTCYPADGANALRFPYETLVRSPKARSDRRASKDAVRVRLGGGVGPLWLAEENGFSSIYEMERAHVPIVGAARAACAGKQGGVIDLGCGNGVLVKKICELDPHLIPYGIDSIGTRVDRAKMLMPNHAGNFICGELAVETGIWRGDRSYMLALLMPGRLLEMTSGQGKQLRSYLRSKVERVLVYAYGDWQRRYGNLQRLCLVAGLRMEDGSDTAVAGLAEVLQ
jgi:hypothetical protein